MRLASGRHPLRTFPCQKNLSPGIFLFYMIFCIHKKVYRLLPTFADFHLILTITDLTIYLGLGLVYLVGLVIAYVVGLGLGSVLGLGLV